MTSSAKQRLKTPGSAIRMDARLDAATRQKVDELASQFHRPRAAIVCQVMRWGLSHRQRGPLDQRGAQGPVRHLYLYVEAELHARVEKAAMAAGMTIAPWLRHMVRQIVITDFPASWQGDRSVERSHNSRTYGTRFMLRLDDLTWATLEAMSMHFERSAAKIIRRLLAQATPDAFPTSWYLRVAEYHTKQVRPVRRTADQTAKG